MKIYTASKLNKRELWRRLQSEWPEFKFHARWYTQVDLGVEETPSNAEVFWVQDHEDVASADAVLVYGTYDDHLRGALVEAGMAIALKIPVVVVGHHEFEYGTWIYHHGVHRAKDLKDARGYLQGLRGAYSMAA